LRVAKQAGVLHHDHALDRALRFAIHEHFEQEGGARLTRVEGVAAGSAVAKGPEVGQARVHARAGRQRGTGTPAGFREGRHIQAEGCREDGGVDAPDAVGPDIREIDVELGDRLRVVPATGSDCTGEEEGGRSVRHHICRIAGALAAGVCQILAGRGRARLIRCRVPQDQRVLEAGSEDKFRRTGTRRDNAAQRHGNAKDCRCPHVRTPVKCPYTPSHLPRLD
jgi:hypothetical protein